mmetsp:Transcript_15375/g.43612  ORF Transcript_15375/g.43612 Transcript_15375/m.43612 type:complete len:267 (+) Transcript_15375:1015-1815(+)
MRQVKPLSLTFGHIRDGEEEEEGYANALKSWAPEATFVVGKGLQSIAAGVGEKKPKRGDTWSVKPPPQKRARRTVQLRKGLYVCTATKKYWVVRGTRTAKPMKYDGPVVYTSLGCPAIPTLGDNYHHEDPPPTLRPLSFRTVDVANKGRMYEINSFAFDFPYSPTRTPIRQPTLCDTSLQARERLGAQNYRETAAAYVAYDRREWSVCAAKTDAFLQGCERLPDVPPAAEATWDCGCRATALASCRCHRPRVRSQRTTETRGDEVL